MKAHELMDQFLQLLESVKAGIFATTGTDGYPNVRWMTAATLNREPDRLYSLTMAGTRKIADLQAEDKISWTFQTPSLNQLAFLKGRASILDNPRLKAEVTEALGPNLTNFWRLHPEAGKLLIIETRIEKITLFNPMQNSRQEGVLE
ncbi:MAG: pyridoxamine 5'-phosphate oxidase family protein [Spirochaetes bacterium]|nr:pyridoxamine 5'-phosphate oxidase family protein [Spirochaetota bacterium]